MAIFASAASQIPLPPDSALAISRGQAAWLRAVYAAVLDEQGHLLWVRHPHELQGWGLPGGKLEQLESAARAVARQVHQCAGLQLAAGDFIPLCSASLPLPGDALGTPWLITTYLHVRPVSRPLVSSPAQALEPQWVPAARLLEAKGLFQGYTEGLLHKLESFVSTHPRLLSLRT